MFSVKNRKAWRLQPLMLFLQQTMYPSSKYCLFFSPVSSLQAGRTPCSCGSHPRVDLWGAVWVVEEAGAEGVQELEEAWQQAVWAPVTACWSSRLSNMTACRPCRTPLRRPLREEAGSWEEVARCLLGHAQSSGHHWFTLLCRLPLPPVM